ncbi:MAG: hypothetical protein ACK532_11480, partial [Acidobacteriota bacterium]
MLVALGVGEGVGGVGGKDGGIEAVVGVIEIAEGEFVVLSQVMVDFGGVVIAGELGDVVSAEVIGAGGVVGGAIGAGEEAAYVAGGRGCLLYTS